MLGYMIMVMVMFMTTPSAAMRCTADIDCANMTYDAPYPWGQSRCVSETCGFPYDDHVRDLTLYVPADQTFGKRLTATMRWDFTSKHFQPDMNEFGYHVIIPPIVGEVEITWRLDGWQVAYGTYDEGSVKDKNDDQNYEIYGLRTVITRLCTPDHASQCTQ